MALIYDVRRWDGFMWHDILAKFHEDWYRRSSNIKGFPLQIWNSAMLVSLKGSFTKNAVEIGLRWHDIRTKFRDDGFRLLSNSTVVTATNWEPVMLVLLTAGNYEYGDEMASRGMI
jgi:hypothetical protein